jgi:hypothetical protein
MPDATEKETADGTTTDATEDKELAAIKAVLDALTPLKPDARSNVIDYVFRRLGITLPAPASSNKSTAPPADPVTVVAQPHHSGAQVDLRSLTNEKDPKTDTQMVAVLAYYLANLAPAGERRDHILPDDIKRYFPSANFELPTGLPSQTLVNAKNAGYLDALGGGQYRLNPVGHNLVTHKLPRGEGSTSSRAPRRKKAAKKKART